MIRRFDSGDDAFDIRAMFDRMNRQFEEMNRQFADARPTFESDAAFSTAMGQSGTSVDVAEHDGTVVVTADLPGFERDEIDLSVAGDAVTIRADHDAKTEEASENYVRRERRHHAVHRTIPLPADVHEEEATASYRNGVLTVTLPVAEREDDDSHHIDID